jgi:hypothetical protein
MRLIALSPIAVALVVLTAGCTASDRQSAAAGDSPRCELSRNAGGCSPLDRPRADEGWRTSAFGGY